MQTVLIHLIFILVILFVIYGIGVGVSFTFFSKKTIRERIAATNDATLERAFKRFRAWYGLLMIWTITEYVFVIIPFVSNVIVIYMTNTENTDAELVLFYSIISLSFIVFAYAINPNRYKKCYRIAYCYLDDSINKYLSLTNGANINSIMLNTAIKKGEDIINRCYDIE